MFLVLNCEINVIVDDNLFQFQIICGNQYFEILKKVVDCKIMVILIVDYNEGE